MSEFEVYEALCAAETVAAQYPSAERLRKRIVHTKEMFSDKKYRLAVVGEFKKGKSSLINALVGSRLLPTNILPTTAVIGRIVYGEDKRIQVCYKNGNAEERTIEDLREYGTKLGGGGEERAALIREIVIKYPSVFCRNGIEIIDTPGLNDNEQMSETTLGVLGEIDSVLVTISAGMPLSLTERELIMTLLEHDGIRHITFVVTFIDRVSEERDEQDRVIEFIRNRIQTDVLADALKRFDGSARLLEKAQELLGEPVLFAVSSTLAMKGFDSDNQKALKESRFPEFKQALFELLISGLDADRHAEAESCIRELSAHMEQFYRQSLDKAEMDFKERQEKKVWREQYFTATRQWIKEETASLDERLKKRGFYPGTGLCGEWLGQLMEIIKNIYVRKLGELRGDALTDESVKKSLTLADESVSETMLRRCGYYERWLQEEFSGLYSRFSDRRTEAGMDVEKFGARVEELKKNCPFPDFKLAEDELLKKSGLTDMDILSAETERVRDCLNEFGRQVSFYIAGRRKAPAKQFMQDCTDWGGLNGVKDLDVQKSFLKYNYQKNRKTVDHCLSLLGRLESE